MTNRNTPSLLAPRSLGSTGIVVTGIGLGGSPLGASGPLDENDMAPRGS